MAKLSFKNKNKNTILEIPQGLSVLEAALEHRVPLYHTCGGNASCSTCRVLVLKGAENLSPIEEAESQVLDAFDLKTPHRLGCQALVMSGEVEVEIPDRTKPPRPNKTPRISEDARGTY